ncbi:carboxypeptidase-like regulatory domain-containing protein [Panacibacter ginsenosidivorans]|uniref:Carboxypeptidase-like regulatory domain-containing protein n=1 Tax=Panacibacter ginsenosidivorans TaxID=1813871 RepID=A0A5B8VCB8_9BACT|nr:carboxypeptidase-like regulatory domain-containing protein [Panacibacter ginsenosidivorans]QEC68643.1 carboxypeptidase-like regulatory domain-containing protein [Panacibacter ginsenosidivorans]
MKRFLQYLICSSFIFLSQYASAQDNKGIQDSVIQLYGVVMTADSLRAIEAASVIVENKGRGTLTNYQGVFSIVVLKGDEIRFSCIGFKDKLITIPDNLKGNQYSVIQLMVSDTAYLPATILKPRPTRSQFERDFVNADVPADQIEIARQNNDEATRRALIAALPADGREAVNANIRKQTQKYYYQGQQPPINLFNPFAWAEFIDAWKRGDFKKKD